MDTCYTLQGFESLEELKYDNVKELLNLFKSVEQLSNDDKKMIITFLDALITKRKVQSLA